MLSVTFITLSRWSGSAFILLHYLQMASKNTLLCLQVLDYLHFLDELGKAISL